MWKQKDYFLCCTTKNYLSFVFEQCSWISSLCTEPQTNMPLVLCWQQQNVNTHLPFHSITSLTFAVLRCQLVVGCGPDAKWSDWTSYDGEEQALLQKGPSINWQLAKPCPRKNNQIKLLFNMLKTKPHRNITVSVQKLNVTTCWSCSLIAIYFSFKWVDWHAIQCQSAVRKSLLDIEISTLLQKSASV